MNAGEALSYGRSSLAGVSDTSARDASLLLAYVLDKPLEHAYLHPQAPVDDESFRLYSELIERRRNGEPIAYLRGVQEFMGFTFKVDRRVLVPRPETELVVEALLGILSPGRRDCEPVGRAPVIADLCCGSGAIGLSVARILPSISVILTDVSREAVALARENADRLGVGEAVTFLVGDLVEPLVRAGMTRQLDAVATNPPYISHDEMDTLPRDVRDYEPRLALDGGHLGLEVIARIARDVPAVLKPGGHVVMEIGADQGDACLEILQATGLWQDVSVTNDYAGRQRVVVGRTRFAG